MEYILVFIIGAIFGSFYNLITIRLPKGESIVLPASHCIFCNRKLVTWDLIPILSYIFLQGRCRYCKTKISKRYIILEIITAIIFVVLYSKFALSWNYLLYISLFSMLILSGVIDYYELVVYDIITRFFASIIIIILLLSGNFSLANIYGAVIGYSFYFIIYFITKKMYGREVFGLGDVEILSAIGLVVGVRKILMVGIFSFYIGLLIYFLKKLFNKNKGKEIAFVPAIAISTLMVIFLDEHFIRIWKFYF